MSAPPSVSEVQVESVVFPAAVKPPGSDKKLFLGGAGVRGMEIEGKFVKFTAIGVYLEDSAVAVLAAKWKSKTAAELADSAEFIAEIITGPFEKLTKVTMILPLTGKQYSEKVAENCTAYWKAVGKYSEAESEAIAKFLQIFKDETFPPGASILFTQSPAGSLTVSVPDRCSLLEPYAVVANTLDLQIAFSKDGSVPEQGKAVIENKLLAEAILESIIGEHGVSPTARQSLAARVSDLLKQT